MPKPSQLQISLCISIFVHAVLLGTLGISGFLVSRPRLEQEDNSVTLNLVAAPDKPVAPPLTIKVVAPAPLSPPELPPVVPVSKPVPVMAVMPPAPQSPVSRTDFHGDASSVKPGVDAITMQAPPEVVAKPDYLKNPRPSYPELALRRHEEGVVLLTVKVTAEGRAANVKIKKSSGFPLLDDAAVAAVRNYEFEPARIGPLAFASEIEVPVHFELKRQ
jgi:protein TonB